jgi:transposase
MCRIKNLERTIEALARQDKDIKRLMTVPGIGLITAVTFKSEIDDLTRFRKSRDVGAYFGMTPRLIFVRRNKKARAYIKMRFF